MAQGAVRRETTHRLSESGRCGGLRQEPVNACRQAINDGQGEQGPVVAPGVVEDPSHPYRRAHGHELVWQMLPAPQWGKGSPTKKVTPEGPIQGIGPSCDRYQT